MGDDYTVTTAQLAEILGVSGDLVRLLTRQKVIPRNGRNEYDLRAAIPAFYARSGGDDADVSEYERERARLTKAKADLAEMEAAERAGTLCNYEEMARVFESEVIKVREAILREVPRRLSLIEPPTDARGRELTFRGICTEALRNISRQGGGNE